MAGDNFSGCECCSQNTQCKYCFFKVSHIGNNNIILLKLILVHFPHFCSLFEVLEIQCQECFPLLFCQKTSPKAKDEIVSLSNCKSVCPFFYLPIDSFSFFISLVYRGVARIFSELRTIPHVTCVLCAQVATPLVYYMFSQHRVQEARC